MTEYSLKPPSVDVLFNPSADGFPHGRVKKSLHRVEGFEWRIVAVTAYDD